MTPADRRFVFLVDGGGGAPHKARELVAASVSGAAFEPAFVDGLLLAVSEVVTNSVTHGAAGEGEVIELALDFDTESVRVEVSDDGPGFAAPARVPRPERVGGLGLPLVKSLSNAFGVAGSHPTRVWFELSPGRERRVVSGGPQDRPPVDFDVRHRRMNTGARTTGGSRHAPLFALSGR